MQAEDYLDIFRVAFKNAGEGVDKERVAIAVMQETQIANQWRSVNKLLNALSNLYIVKM